MRMRVRVLTVVVLVFAACGDSGAEPDWEGYAEYLNAEVRDTPVTPDELKDIFDGAPTCDEGESAVRWGLADARTLTDAQAQTATDYFLCGADFARRPATMPSTALKRPRSLRSRMLNVNTRSSM